MNDLPPYNPVSRDPPEPDDHDFVDSEPVDSEPDDIVSDGDVSDGGGSDDLMTPGDGEPAPPQGPELLGATDIVEAFTALRHELKLQVRHGRDLQQALCDGVQRIERAIIAQQTPVNSGSELEEARQLAAAVAEMEESLQRAVETVPLRTAANNSQESLVDDFDRTVMRASWGARRFAGKLLQEVRRMIEQSASEMAQVDATHNATRRGLELLQRRVQRLMQQCGIERVDVVHRPFDAETMHALDVIDAPSVPSSHVAEQLRPAYLWRGKILRCADVRIAR